VSDLVAFLSARLDEREAAARALGDPDWGMRPWQVEECAGDGASGCPCIVYQGEYKPVDQPQVPTIQYIADGEAPEYAAHIARYDPARVLREVEAGRNILARYEDCLARQEDQDYPYAPAVEQAREYEDFVLPNLAAVDSDHPDYDPEWRP
jgi:hypothetical protein